MIEVQCTGLDIDEGTKLRFEKGISDIINMKDWANTRERLNHQNSIMWGVESIKSLLVYEKRSDFSHHQERIDRIKLVTIKIFVCGLTVETPNQIIVKLTNALPIWTHFNSIMGNYYQNIEE